MELAEAVILEDHKVSIAKITAKLGINVACPWCNL
jgi:hypothetical protein